MKKNPRLYLEHIRQKIYQQNNDKDPETLLYVGSGADISTALLLTNAGTLIGRGAPPG